MRYINKGITLLFLTIPFPVSYKTNLQIHMNYYNFSKAIKEKISLI